VVSVCNIALDNEKQFNLRKGFRPHFSST